MSEYGVEDTENQKPTEIPRCIKYVLISGLGIVLFFVVWQYLLYVHCPINGKSPSNLGLPTLFVFSASGLFLLLIPLKKLGLRIKKMGPLEFEQIVETQASEHAKDISEIEERFDYIENNINGFSAISQVDVTSHVKEIHDLLINFLSTNNRKSFSPLRIRKWGSKQTGFEKLKDFDLNIIRKTLRKLVAKGALQIKVSEKGNTLYQIIE